MNNLYKEAGVDTKKGDQLVDWLSKDSRSGLLGGFAGLFDLDLQGIRKPKLIACTDGVGTKLLLGLEHNQLSGLGQDLVAMCVNDLFTTGGKPLFFLDYYATGVLDVEQFKEVLTGVKKALTMCNTTLLGGETAELPGLYQENHFDLAGFLVGIVDEENLLQPTSVLAGDTLYALPSSGLHSNGYSLIRKLIDTHRLSADKELINRLLVPTRIYSELQERAPKLKSTGVKSIAHITGGGISGNLPRALAKNCKAVLSKKMLKTPSWFAEFMQKCGLEFAKVEPVFNLGVGMIIAVDSTKKAEFEKLFEDTDCYPIGYVENSGDKESFVQYVD